MDRQVVVVARVKVSLELSDLNKHLCVFVRFMR